MLVYQDLNLKPPEYQSGALPIAPYTNKGGFGITKVRQPSPAYDLESFMFPEELLYLRSPGLGASVDPSGFEPETS